MTQEQQITLVDRNRGPNDDGCQLAYQSWSPEGVCLTSVDYFATAPWRCVMDSAE